MADANAEHADDKANADAGNGGETGDPTPEEQIAKLTEDLATSETKATDLASKLGTQSSQIGELKKFADEMTNDPKALIGRIADGAGIKVDFDAKPAIGTDITGLEPEQISKLVQGITAEVKAELDPVAKAAQDATVLFNQQALSSKYSDFDSRGQEMDTLKVAVASNNMSGDELLYLASIGQAREGIVADAMQKGADEKLAELNKKAEEQISGGGTTSKDKGKGHTAESAADRLNRVRGR